MKITPFNNLNQYLLGTAAAQAGRTARHFLNNWNRPSRPSQREDMARFRTLRSARRPRRASRVQTMTRNKYKSRTGILGGTNANQRMIYRRKSMPRKKKRRWRSFIRKVNAVDERELGTQTVLFNDQISQDNTSTSTPQSCLTLCLYSQTNVLRDDLNDLTKMASNEQVLDPTAAVGTTTYDTTKMMFHSAIMDITLRNVSTIRNADTTYALAPEASIELDVYEWYGRKEFKTGTTDYQDLTRLLNGNDVPEIAGTGTGISMNDRGATPFEFGHQMGKYGIKILKKTKYFIPNGSTITHQIRDPKRRVAQKKDLIDQEGFNRPGWTKGLFLVYKFVPGVSLGSNINYYQLRLAVGSTRKYSYKIEGRNESRERLYGTTISGTALM